MKQSRSSPIDFQHLYNGFNSPVTSIDCGLMCAPFNKTRKPVCCDICRAVPVAYRQEWQHLRGRTSLWHRWRGNECEQEPAEKESLTSQTPRHLLLLACAGPQACQREYRAVSCRQFPFFPYITPDFRFIGLTYDWEFTSSCWVISNLHLVSRRYRDEFIAAFDAIFSIWLEDLDAYAALSEDTRAHYSGIRRRIPLLHRNSKDYLVSPESNKMKLITPQEFPRFKPFTDTPHSTFDPRIEGLKFLS